MWFLLTFLMAAALEDEQWLGRDDGGGDVMERGRLLAGLTNQL